MLTEGFGAAGHRVSAALFSIYSQGEKGVDRYHSAESSRRRFILEAKQYVRVS
jgi:hypothetical protein